MQGCHLHATMYWFFRHLQSGSWSCCRHGPSCTMPRRLQALNGRCNKKCSSTMAAIQQPKKRTTVTPLLARDTPMWALWHTHCPAQHPHSAITQTHGVWCWRDRQKHAKPGQNRPAAAFTARIRFPMSLPGPWSGVSSLIGHGGWPHLPGTMRLRILPGTKMTFLTSLPCAHTETDKPNGSMTHKHQQGRVRWGPLVLVVPTAPIRTHPLFTLLGVCHRHTCPTCYSTHHAIEPRNTLIDATKIKGTAPDHIAQAERSNPAGPPLSAS